MPTIKTDKQEFLCFATRHQTGSEFKTYNTMLAMAKSDPNRDKEAALIFHGKLTKLANYNNSSIEVERLNINSLMKKGWLVRLGKQRWRAGRWSTVQYLIVEHAEYAALAEFPFNRDPGWQPCPPYRYDMETGEPVASGKLKPGLAKAADDKKRDMLIRALVTDGLRLQPTRAYVKGKGIVDLPVAKKRK